MTTTQIAYLIEMMEQKQDALSDYPNDEQCAWQYEMGEQILPHLREMLGTALKEEGVL